MATYHFDCNKCTNDYTNGNGDSAIRHYLKHLRGDHDEPHDRAFLWNVFCLWWTRENITEREE